MALVLRARQVRTAVDAALSVPRKAAGYVSRLIHKLHLDSAFVAETDRSTASAAAAGRLLRPRQESPARGRRRRHHQPLPGSTEERSADAREVHWLDRPQSFLLRESMQVRQAGFVLRSSVTEPALAEKAA